MNINCPHCTAYLTVPEQYSGQLMKCPKCNSNFTVPALPAVDQEPAFAMAQNPPAPAAPAPASPMAPSIPLAPEVPAFNLAPPEPAFSHSPAPSPGPAPSPSPRPAPTPTPKPATPSAPPGTSTHSHHLPISRTVLQWVAVGAVVVLFVLTFFPWVGIYPGGVPVVTQSAWGAAFGGESVPDADLKDMLTIVPEAEAKTANSTRTQDLKLEVVEPKGNLLLIFYLLPFLLLTVLASIAVAVLPFVHVQLPPVVANLLPWKWGILALLNAVLLLFLVLQLLLNFGIESSVKDAAQIKAENSVRGRSPADPKEKPASLNTPEQKKVDALKGIYSEWAARTIWLRLALVLHLLATAAAATAYWMEKRGVEHLRLEWGARW